MRKLLILGGVLVVASMTSCGGGEEASKSKPSGFSEEMVHQGNDLARLDLKGPVQIVIERGKQPVYENGEIVAKDGGKSNARIEREFDAEGNLISEIRYTNDGSIASEVYNKYNDQGRLVETFNKGLSGDTTVTKWSYEMSGDTLVRTIVEGEEPSTTKIVFDENGNEIYSEIRDTTGSVEYITETTYNQKGYEIESVIKFTGTDMKNYVRYTRDIKGRATRIETGRTMSADLKDPKAYTEQIEYDEYWNVTQRLSFSGDHQTESHTYEYELDPKGNWVRKIHFIDGEPYKWVEREITYYE